MIPSSPANTWFTKFCQKHQVAASGDVQQLLELAFTELVSPSSPAWKAGYDAAITECAGLRWNSPAEPVGPQPLTDERITDLTSSVRDSFDRPAMLYEYSRKLVRAAERELGIGIGAAKEKTE